MAAPTELMTDREKELRVFDIDEARIRPILLELGAKSLGTTVFKRAVFDVNPVDPDKWIRLRTDGERTMLAVKQRISEEADGTGELEIEVSDYDTTMKILSSIGNYVPRSIQENTREAFLVEGVEVTIDKWPKLNPLLEIEAQDPDSIYRTAQDLQIPQESLTGKSVEQHYLDTLGLDVKYADLRIESSP